jgi:tRNA(adenine34) deaminase
LRHRADGRIIGEAHNHVTQFHDPTAHAEIVAMRRAGERLKQPRFIACGAQRAQVHKMYFEDRHFETMDFIRDAFKDDLTVTGGVLPDACAGLYYGPDDDPPAAEQANR